MKKNNIIDKREATKNVLKYAVDIMNTAKIYSRAAGFEAWAKAIGNDKEFPKDAALTLLTERLMCQTDAMAMIGEGRWCAGEYLKEISCLFPESNDDIIKASELFKKEQKIVQSMSQLLGGLGMGEKQARNLGNCEIRKQLVEMIQTACNLDKKAVFHIQEVINKDEKAKK